MPAGLKSPSIRALHDEMAESPPKPRLRLRSGRLSAVVLLVLIVGLSLFLVDLLKRRAASSGFFRVDPSEISLGETPDFVPERVVAELQALVQVEPRSIFDSSLVDELSSSVARHPWVKGVPAANRVLPNKVALEIVLREPVAVVEVGSWKVTVDSEGWVLEDHASLAPPGLVRIRGDKKSIPRIPRVGSPFRSQAVVDGVAVAVDLAKCSDHVIFRYAKIATIDVTGVGKEKSSEIVVEIQHGPLVDWGSAPSGALGPIELPASKKLDNLLIVHDRNPGFRGIARINAATDSPFVTLSQ
jgi:hypothetical protein